MNQDRALKFHTEVLGFVKKHDIPVGEFKWLTVVSPEEPSLAWKGTSTNRMIVSTSFWRKYVFWNHHDIDQD
jgi:hypothetical protein